LSDTVKGRQMKSDGAYVRRAAAGRKRAVNTQEWLLKQVTQKTEGRNQESGVRSQKSE